MSLVLGVDIGTASTKAVAVDEDGAVVARVERAHRTATPRPGWFEHDATNVWWKDLTECLTELLPQLGEAPVALGSAASGPVCCQRMRRAGHSGRPSCTASTPGPASRCGR